MDGRVQLEFYLMNGLFLYILEKFVSEGKMKSNPGNLCQL
jgi:hypothetical protein